MANRSVSAEIRAGWATCQNMNRLGVMRSYDAPEELDKLYYYRWRVQCVSGTFLNEEPLEAIMELVTRRNYELPSVVPAAHLPG